MNALRIRKGYLIGLGTWLNEQQLSGRPSRERTRFVQEIDAELKRTDADRVKLLEELADKDEDGTPRKEQDEATGQEKFILSEESQQKFAQEYVSMMNEDWIVDVTEANRDQLQTVKTIVLNTDYRFGPHDDDTEADRQSRIRQMNDYPHWCDAFEAVDVQ